MSKENKKLMILVIAVGFISLVSLIISCTTLHAVRNLPDASVSYTCPTSDTEPSIFTDFTCEYAGEETVSLENGTIDYNISLSPKEFSENTVAKVTIGDNTCTLERDGNQFRGSMPVSLFEEVYAEASLDDNGTIRTEGLIYGDAPVIDTSGVWYSSGDSLQTTEKGVKIDNYFTYSCDYVAEPAEPVQLLVTYKDKTIFQKDLDINYDPNDNAEYKCKGLIPLKGEGKATVYLTYDAPYGLQYVYQMGTLSRKSSFIDASQQVLQIKDKDGNVLYDEVVDTEEE